VSSITIDGFVIDEANEEEFAGHGLSAGRVTQVLERTFVVLRNRKGRRGLYLIVGRDRGGAYISTPIERTGTTGVWRPITAWPSKAGERTLLEKHEGH